MTSAAIAAGVETFTQEVISMLQTLRILLGALRTEAWISKFPGFFTAVLTLILANQRSPNETMLFYSILFLLGQMSTGYVINDLADWEHDRAAGDIRAIHQLPGSIAAVFAGTLMGLQVFPDPDHALPLATQSRDARFDRTARNLLISPSTETPRRTQCDFILRQPVGRTLPGVWIADRNCSIAHLRRFAGLAIWHRMQWGHSPPDPRLSTGREP